MIEDCPETDIEFDALGLTIAHKQGAPNAPVRLSGSIDEGAAASRHSSGIEHSIELVSDGPGIKTPARQTG
jgi:hypothetical protein